MKLSRTTSWVATAVALAAGAASAQAQAPAAGAPAPVTTEVAAPTPEPGPVAAEVAAPAPEPAPAPVEATTGPAEVTSMEPMSEKDQAAEEDHEMAESGLAISMFADAYYNQDWNLPPNSALGANGTQGHSAYVNSQGFGLGFLGLDLAYSSGTVGATASLRYGTAANRLIGQYGNGLTLENIWQAYVTWAPVDGLTLDLGQFATLYGAEVGESWLNLNYTRGALYYNFQPFWHTGLRVAYQLNEQMALKFLVTNGVNTGLATTQYGGPPTRAPDVGVQFAYAGDGLSAYVGYYGNPIKPDGKAWSNFFDVVLVGAFGDATIIFNGDVGMNDLGDKSHIYYGVSLAGGYALSDTFGLALRGEYLGAPDELGPAIDDPMNPGTNIGGSGFANFGKSLVTATLTLDYKPTENLVIRLDNRLEAADLEIFRTKDDTSKTYISSTLGVVVHTN